MKTLYFARQRLFTFAALLLLASFSSPSFSEASHGIVVNNNSNSDITVIPANTPLHMRCVYDQGVPVYIPSKQQRTIVWTDSNNYNQGCTNRDKFVIMQFANSSSLIWDNMIGMTHRKLTSNWYNGFFYVQSLTGQWDASTWQWNDGTPPPSYISTNCVAGVNGCLGTFTGMEYDGKNDYNWPKMFQTENGWTITISDPPSEAKFKPLTDEQKRLVAVAKKAHEAELKNADGTDDSGSATTPSQK